MLSEPLVRYVKRLNAGTQLEETILQERRFFLEDDIPRHSEWVDVETVDHVPELDDYEIANEEIWTE